MISINGKQVEIVTGRDLRMGDNFMPLQHPWAALGELTEVLRSNPNTKTFSVKRTASASGRERTEIYAAPHDAHYFREVRND